MSGSFTKYYLVRPKNSLLETLSTTEDNWLKKPEIWECKESIGQDRDGDKMLVYMFKVIFLSKIIKSSKFLHPRIQSTIEKLFGSPPQFSIQAFDKWWTVERIDAGPECFKVLLNATADELEMISKTGDKEQDEWLEKLTWGKKHL